MTYAGRKPGRKMHFPEKREIAMREGTIAAITDLRVPHESMADFLRTAVDREIERRSTAP